MCLERVDAFRQYPGLRPAPEPMNAQPPLLPPGMHVIQRDWLSSNQVLFVGRDNATLVDSGYVTHADTTLALVRRALGERRLDRVVNTHLHSDHCGGNATLERAYGCRVAVPVGSFDAVRAWDESHLSFAATGQRCERFMAHEAVSPGDVVRLGDADWQALAAPGHDPLSLVLWQPEHRVVISADALWEDGFGVIFPELEGEPGFAEQRDTLELIARLDAALAIPGHGAPFADVPQALARARSRLDYLAADPVRNARLGLKVLLKFLLLERRALALDEIEQLLGTAAYFVRTNQRFFGLSPQALARFAIDELVRTGAARFDGAVLSNA